MALIKLNNIDKIEALRYMGYRNLEDNKPIDSILELLDECENTIITTVEPQYTYKVFDLSFDNEDIVIDKTILKLKSKTLYAHLKNCEKVIMLAATMSSKVDHIARIYENENILKAMVFDACCNAAIEQVCDIAENKLATDYKDYSLTYRYGIGYGDLSLAYQDEFLRILDADKVIGLNDTANYILTPRKSVTCFIGLSKKNYTGTISINIPEKHDCSKCNLVDSCNYKKEGKSCDVQ